VSYRVQTVCVLPRPDRLCPTASRPSVSYRVQTVCVLPRPNRLCPTASRPSPGPALPLRFDSIHRISFFQRANWPKCEAGHLYPSSEEAKREQIFPICSPNIRLRRYSYPRGEVYLHVVILLSTHESILDLGSGGSGGNRTVRYLSPVTKVFKL
jgi:hypothetical protein